MDIVFVYFFGTHLLKGKFPIKRRIESKVGFTREGEQKQREGIQQDQQHSVLWT